MSNIEITKKINELTAMEANLGGASRNPQYLNLLNEIIYMLHNYQGGNRKIDDFVKILLRRGRHFKPKLLEEIKATNPYLIEKLKMA